MTVTMTPGPWLEALYPGEDAEALQERLDEVLAWVYYFAPCTEGSAFPNDGTKAKLIHSIVKRAMRYDHSTADGAVVSHSAGPFTQTFDNRRTTSPNVFSASQIELLRGMCGTPAQFGAVTVALGAPHGVQ